MADPFKESEVENLAFKLILKDKKPVSEAHREMKSQGYEISEGALRRFKKEMFGNLVKSDNRERFADSMLNSIDRITGEFDELFSRTKNLVDKLEKEGRDYEAMIGIRELREQITLALKRLGEFKIAINQIKAEKVNIINTQEFVMAMKQTQEGWFDTMDAEMNGENLVFKKPRAEMVEAYRVWEARSKLKSKD